MQYRPTGVYRSKACVSVFACMVRLQLSNVSVRDCLTIGVQAHLSCPLRAIMWNVAPQCLRPLGRLTVRHAVGGLGGEALRSECLAVMVGIAGEIFLAP